MIRIGDAKVVDHVFNRESLCKMNVAFADNLIDRYLKALEKSLNDIQAGSDFYADNFGILLAQVIPEILSRLCCKCSLEFKNKLLDFLFDVYKTDQRVKYQGISNLTKRLIDSYSDRQQLNIIPKLLEFPVLGNLGARMDREFLNPFSFLRIDKEQTAHWNKPKIEEKQILSLLIQADSEIADIRKWAISTLYTLYQLNLLKRNSSVELGKVLWSQLDPFGFPDNTNCCKFDYLDLPHPDNVDPVLMFKKYIQDTPFPIQKSSTGFGVFPTGYIIPVCHEIVEASRFYQWTEEEALDMFGRIVEWWDADKGYLKKDEKLPLFGSSSEMFGNNLLNLINVLVAVVLPALKPEMDIGIKGTINRLLTELREYGLPSLRAAAASIHVFPDIKKEIISRIEDSLTSCNHKVVIDGLDAVFLILKNSQTILNKLEVTNIVNLLCQIIKWRRKTGLVSTLNMVYSLIKEQRNFFTGELEGFILNDLAKLADETNLAFDFADMDFPEKLEIRKSAARLAYVIFENYSTQGKTIPGSIKVWKEICRSEEDFAEIRNQWLTIEDELPND
ncbi:MAG: hypothetical protein HW390_1973 [Candidatus Brocadiaceae bacterium]|nr:hypothetical protein [Candidatus Brocadiaceae bacterium]